MSRKTVGMVCHPYQASGVWADEAFTQHMMGAGKSYRERQREWVNCLEFRKEFSRGSLAAYHQTHHGVAKGALRQEGNREGGGDKPRMYKMTFPAKAVPKPCPVESCSGQTATRAAMWMHF